MRLVREVLPAQLRRVWRDALCVGVVAVMAIGDVVFWIAGRS